MFGKFPVKKEVLGFLLPACSLVSRPPFARSAEDALTLLSLSLSPRVSPHGYFVVDAWCVREVFRLHKDTSHKNSQLLPSLPSPFPLMLSSGFLVKSLKA